MEFSDFYNFKAILLITSLTKDSDEQKVQWLKVKRFEIVKEVSVVKYSYDYTLDFKEIPFLNCTPKRKTSKLTVKRPMMKKYMAIDDVKNISIPKLYKEPLKISTRKKKDLMDLLSTGVIPQYYANFYTSLQVDSQLKDSAVFEDLLEEEEIEEILFQ